jgi:hypothetical protein
MAVPFRSREHDITDIVAIEAGKYMGYTTGV